MTNFRPFQSHILEAFVRRAGKALVVGSCTSLVARVARIPRTSVLCLSHTA